jgi:PhnB protein
MAYISPHLSVDDVAKSLDYYERVLGFQKGLTLPDEEGGGGLSHGEARLGELMVMFGPAGHPENRTREKLEKAGGVKGAGITLYLDIGEQDIDRYYEDVKAAGAKVTEEIEDQFWGDRTFTIEDPDGYVITFAKHVRDVEM